MSDKTQRLAAILILTVGVVFGGAALAEAKQIVMVIAPGNFSDPELFDTKAELTAAGHQVKVACSTTNPVTGMHGGKATADLLLDKVRVQDFDAIVFVGGVGVKAYYDHPQALKLAKDFAAAGKVTSAICLGPVVLANAGVLNGKKATVYSSGATQLKQKGASYTGGVVVRDGNIITGNGPQASKEFGKQIAAALK